MFFFVCVCVCAYRCAVGCDVMSFTGLLQARSVCRADATSLASPQLTVLCQVESTVAWQRFAATLQYNGSWKVLVLGI